MTRSTSMPFVIAALMLAAGIGAVVARPSSPVLDPKPTIELDAAIPREFGDWSEQPQHRVRIVNPSLQEYLDEIYSQVLERVYINAEGYRIMLSVAYGTDQRDYAQAHDPEFCYEGEGFTLHDKESGPLETRFGSIPVSRLYMSKGKRMEPITYWIMVGDKAPPVWQRTLVRMGYTVTGRVPVGLVFRVSSIDLDRERAIRLHDQFIKQLVASVPAAERKHLSGLGDSSN